MHLSSSRLRQHLLSGLAIPALPLALTNKRKWDERSQKALVRYYVDAGAGGIAVGVHSTQFEIRSPSVGLYAPVLELASTTSREWQGSRKSANILIAGLCGITTQALAEARIALRYGYHAGLLSLGAWRNATEGSILKHCRQVAREIPLIGFYLQSAVGGRSFSYRFWRRFAEIPELVAVKIAPFNRYRTVDVVRAIVESGREDVALYTGNDDNIIADLITPFSFNGETRFISGGLLGQWGVWTKSAVELLNEIKVKRTRGSIPKDLLARNVALTDANDAIFDSANGFHGCLPGIHEVLRRQGLLSSVRCLNPLERLSPGQAEELSRVSAAYPWLTDDRFVEQNLTRWRS